MLNSTFIQSFLLFDFHFVADINFSPILLKFLSGIRIEEDRHIEEISSEHEKESWFNFVP